MPLAPKGGRLKIEKITPLTPKGGLDNTRA